MPIQRIHCYDNLDLNIGGLKSEVTQFSVGANSPALILGSDGALEWNDEAVDYFLFRRSMYELMKSAVLPSPFSRATSTAVAPV